MITVHCPEHGRPVLLSLRRIVGIENAAERVTVHWACWCGHQGRDSFQRPGSREDYEAPAAVRA